MHDKNVSDKGLEELKTEISLKAKNGVDFLLAATVCWFGIFIIWRYSLNSSYEKSVFTFILGGGLLPLAFAFSKIINTTWKIKDNPLQPLGLWLNFAQLIYFPFLIFIFVKYPDYFIMAYAIITGAHLFPYTWFYEEKGYAVAAVTISVGAMVIALLVGPVDIFYVPLYTSSLLLLLVIRILYSNNIRIKTNRQA